MLSFPHLVVLFVIALVIFGPQKLPELARMLGKATAEFRKMTSDFRYALEDEVRELERQTRIRDEEAASALRAAQTVQPVPDAVPRTTQTAEEEANTVVAKTEPIVEENGYKGIGETVPDAEEAKTPDYSNLKPVDPRRSL